METPTFLVIGAQKCGTTSLYQYVKQHPDVFMSPVKELRFFSGEAASPEAAAIGGPLISDFQSYCEYFDGSTSYEAAGEVSPSYMFYPGTAERINRHLPDVRLICILRDPVERAFSEYWHHWKMGRELGASFLDFALNEEVEEEPQLADYQDCVRRGLYHRQLRPYFDVFDEDKIMVLFYDDLRGDAESLIKSVYNFIGVDSDFNPDVDRIHNRGVMPKRDFRYYLGGLLEWGIDLGVVDEEARMAYRRRIRRGLNLKRRSLRTNVRKRLVRLFRDDIKKLEHLTGRDLEAWYTVR